MMVKFYNANKKCLWQVEAEMKGDLITAAVPAASARYFSCEVDGHALHEIPTYDPAKVEYRT